MTGANGVNNAYSMDAEEFRSLGYKAVDIAANYLSNVGQKPVFQRMTPAQRQALLETPLAEPGIEPNKILEIIEQQIMPHPMGNGHPRFFGWVNSPPAPVAVLSELLAAALNPSCAGGDHAAIYLEHGVIRTLMDLIGFPSENSYGLLVSGGSMATLTGLAAARHWASSEAGWNVREEGLYSDHPQLILYMSEEGHSCVRKAAELLGLGRNSIRVIPTSETFQIRLEELEKAIERDRQAGLQPFCVVANAGTVNTGTVDPLEELAGLCQREKLWLHVDGAYGAVGKLDREKAALFRGLEKADSIAIDPHKWLSVPVECGCILVRDRQVLRNTFSLVPLYLRLEEGAGFGELPWFAEFGFQQTRGFRALKLWTVLQSAGREGLENQVTGCNRLAQRLTELLEEAADFEVVVPANLSIVCFRYTPTELTGQAEKIEKLNRRLVSKIQEGGEAFLTSTELRGKFVLRACILHYATTEEDLIALLDIIRKYAKMLGTSAL